METNPFSGIKTYDSYRQLFELFLFAIALSVVLSAGAALFLNKLLGLGIKFEEIYILTQGLVAFVICLGVLKERGVDFQETWRDWNRNALNDILTALKYYGVYLLIIAALISLAYLLGHMFTAPQEAVLKHLETQTARDTAVRGVMGVSRLRFLFLLLSICVVTPLGEELLYRRLIYATLRKRLGFFKALFASSVIFSAAHLSASLAVFPVSLLFGYIYEKKRRLPVNIMLHGLINLFATTAHIFL
ncbi:MAG: CPBP family intramembrane metalloprotease [Elusimicrobia bacterium]|nr:CPBP family intramembrane metalloprotease [Elusimicrobiota bacterium]